MSDQDKSDAHRPEAPAPAEPGDADQDKAGQPGDEPTRPDGAVEDD